MTPLARVPLCISPRVAAAFEESARGLARSGRNVEAANLRALSDAYTREQGRVRLLPETPAEAQAFLRHFAPLTAAKIRQVLEAHPASTPRHELRVLDLGCGPLAATAGLLDWLIDHRKFLPGQIHITAIDRHAALLGWGTKILPRLLREAAPKARTRLTIEAIVASLSMEFLAAFPPERKFDVILSANWMAEIPELAFEERIRAHALTGGLLPWVLAHLADRGAALIIEPGTHAASRVLQWMREGLSAEARRCVVEPCAAATPCPLLPRERDWCHFITRVAKAPEAWTARCQRAGIDAHRAAYSRLVLVAPAAAGRLTPAPGLIRCVGGFRRTRGRAEIEVCGGGVSGKLVRLDKHASAANAAFTELLRGDLIRVTTPGRQGDEWRLLPDSQLEVLGYEGPPRADCPRPREQVKIVDDAI